MKIHFNIPILVIILAVSVVAACQKVEISSEPVRIGLITYVDEHEKSVGIPTLNAAQMAVDEVNASGGIIVAGEPRKVELIVEGIASSPQNAVAATRKMINAENVVAMVGLHYSLDAIPAGRFAERARVPLISPMSTNRLTTEGRNYVFRMSFVDDLQGAVMARYAYQDLGARRAAVLFNRSDPYGSGISDVFKSTFIALGGEVVSSLSYVDSVDSYHSLVVEINESKPDVLYLPGFAVDVARQVREIRQQGVDVQLLGADGWNSQRFSTNSDFEGSYLTNHWIAGMDVPGSDSFVKRYRELFGDLPEAVSALTYDSMNILFTALGSSNQIDGESIRDRLVDMGPFDGVSGTIDFVDSGDPVKGVVVLRLHQGEVHFQKIVQQGVDR